MFKSFVKCDAGLSRMIKFSIWIHFGRSSSQHINWDRRDFRKAFGSKYDLYNYGTTGKSHLESWGTTFLAE